MDSKLSISKKGGMNFSVLMKEYGIFFALIVLIIICSFVSPVFFTYSNIQNILLQVCINGILAICMTFVMIGGGFDLSVGSTLSLCGALAIGMQKIFPVYIAIIIALIVGCIVGSLNGAIMAKIKGDNGDAFMITFGTQSFIAAVALLYTGGITLRGSESASFNFVGQGFVGKVPMPILIFIVIAVLAHFLLSKTRFGRGVYAIGGNYEASRLSGINVGVIKAATYILAGAGAAVASIIINSRTMGASPVQGVGYEFDAITAVIIGGTSLNGGEGSIVKTIIGVLILGVISNIMNLFGFTPHEQYIVKGIIILLAVFIDRKK
jgi:ribose transport system permease protein